VALKFQYNRTAQQGLEKQLRVRERALPTLKNKESALRVEVKRAKDKIIQLEETLARELNHYETMTRLWGEFDKRLVKIQNVNLTLKKIAGVKTPLFDNIEFEAIEYNLFNSPVWFQDGINIVKQIASIGIEKEVFLQKMQLLEFARKKTTQKVNLYEKVQIPEYQDAIRKIKRFMEDEENLSKSAQKIVKNRQQQQMEEAL